MQAFALYKVVTIVLLIITGGTVSATALYYQQNAQLNTKVSTLTASLNSTQSQVTTLSGQVAQVQNINSQLLTTNTRISSQLANETNQLAHLETELAALQSTGTGQTQTVTVSQGSISLSGYGSAEYVPFTVQSNLLAMINVSYSASGSYSVKSALLSQTQYSTLLTCNCIGYGNYTSTTWLSPTALSYTTQITVPYSGLWYFAYMEPPGTGSGLTLSETIKLITHPFTSQTTQTLSSGSVNVPFNGISYLTFSVLSLPATLNITFQITNFNSYYPQSIALYLLDPSQHALFLAGNYSSSTWSYPYSTSIATTQIIVPSTGSWYFAFQEQDPNGGFPATASYLLQLTSQS